MNQKNLQPTPITPSTVFDLSEVPTCHMVRELEKRESVRHIFLGPEDEVRLHIQGVNTILVIDD